MEINIAEAFINGKPIAFDPEEKIFKIQQVAEKVALKVLNQELTPHNPLSIQFLDELSEAFEGENLKWLEISKLLVEKLSSLENPKALETKAKIIHAQTLYKTAHPILNSSTPTFLKADLDYVTKSVETNGLSLVFADIELRNTESVLEKAVTQNGLSLRYGTETMRGNLDLCKKAVLQNPLAIKLAYSYARHDRDLSKLAVVLDPKTLIYTGMHASDPEFLLECINSNLKVFLKIDEDLRNDPSFQKKVLDLIEGQDPLKDRILKYNNREIRTLLISKLLEISTSVENAEGIKIHKPTGFPEHFSTAAISPLFTKIVCQSWDASPETLIELESSTKKAFFKDGKKRQALLYVLKNINECEIENAQKVDLILSVLGTKEDPVPGQEEILERLVIFALTIKLLDTETLLSIEDFSAKSLKTLMLGELISQGFIEKDKIEAFLSVLNHSRMPTAIFSYLKHFVDDEDIKPIITQFLNSLCDGSFLTLRHHNNSYKSLLSEEQLAYWQTDKSMKFDDSHEIFDSENWQDLFLCGTEVISCQRVDGFKEFNKCLMGYVLDGKIRILCLKDSVDSPIKARCMLKILKKEDGTPCLLLEKLYPAFYETASMLIRTYAISLAEKLKIPLFEGSELKTGISIYSDKINPGLWEYADSGPGITNGIYDMEARAIF